MARDKKPVDDSLIPGLNVDGADALGYLQMVPQLSNPAVAAIEVLKTDLQLAKEDTMAMQEMDFDNAALRRCRAYKQWCDSRKARYGDNLLTLAAGVAGGAATVAAVSLLLGPPGFLFGLAVTGIGGVIGTTVKNHVAPSNEKDFLGFVHELRACEKKAKESGGKEGIPEEMVFVALAMNAHSSVYERICKSLAREGVKGGDPIEALKSEEGRATLREMMALYETDIRASLDSSNGLPGVSLYEDVAHVIDTGQMPVMMMFREEIRPVVTQIDMIRFNQMRQLREQEREQGFPPNPNQGLPEKQPAGKTPHVSANA